MEYKDTLSLPKTDFGMKAKLAQKEPELLSQWESVNIHEELSKKNADQPKFSLHDGPPYANGHLHMGHALNKILKDIVNRSQSMMGKSIYFTPGWDCHGLPIEWEIEKQYREKGKNKDSISTVEFRQECRQFAKKWVDIQREEFKRLGILADWNNPYLTMDYKSEALIYRELSKFLMDGSLYRGARPVMWSVVEKTALAEAEIEYQEHRSNTIYVRFPVQTASDPVLEGADVVIWTTTPWTIPGNRAIGFHNDITYSVFEVISVDENAYAEAGDKFALCDELAERVKTHSGILEWRKLGSIEKIKGTHCKHPLHELGYDFDIPLLHGDFVTTEQGTGFVHIAPGHGTDDFNLGRKHGLEIPETVDEAGVYTEKVPCFAGLSVLKSDGTKGEADNAVIEKLISEKKLLSKGTLRHSYPHSWRSKAPLIFRTTYQWFIDVHNNSLKEKALKAIEDIKFYPKQAETRLKSMIENRPDWCVSRQRTWGVPIAIFINKDTGEPLRDQKVVDRIFEAFSEEGGDAWFTSPASRFLGDQYDENDFIQVFDVLDVWFESATTHSFVVEESKNLNWPCDLYLEGSDQHRGWFQHSLLEACGTRGTSPFKRLLTHGFVVDAKGKKMSKSMGNVIAPQKIIEAQGADILRLWVVACDYSDDIRIGQEIIKHQTDMYRRIRNTLRFIIGNLNEFDESEKVRVQNMPELEQWVMHKVAQVHETVVKSYNEYDFHKLFTTIHNFCAVDLSAFYFDIRKDSLYCDHVDALRRRACRTVLNHLFQCITKWLAPILCFTMEEAWQSLPSNNSSIHLESFPNIQDNWLNSPLDKKWEKIRDVRRVVTGAIEKERINKTIGSSLEAHPTIYCDDESWHEYLDDVDLAEICITSSLNLIDGNIPEAAFVSEDCPGIGVVVSATTGNKCERCWMILPEVGTFANHKTLCARCIEAVETIDCTSDRSNLKSAEV